MPDYKKIKAEYIAGGVSIAKLAAKHGVSSSTLSKISMKEKWTDLRKKTGIKQDEKISEAVSRKSAKKADTLIQAADILLSTVILKMTNGDYDMSPQSVKQLTGALKDIKDIKGFKTEADLREQEARIKKLEKEIETDDRDKEILIRIDNGLEEYSS